MPWAWDSTKQQWVNNGTGATEPDPQWNAQNQQFDATLGQIQAKQNTLGAQKNQLAAGYATNAAQQGVLPYTQATLNAKRGVLGAQQGTFGPQAGVISANRNVVGAQQTALGGARDLIGKQQAENQTQKNEFGQIIAARDNFKDKAAVATMQRYNAARDSRARLLGMVPDAEVQVPVGFTGKLGLGLRAAPTTQEQDVTQTVKTNQTNRGFDMESAKLAVQLMNTDVDQARIVAAQAGLTLDEAQLAVSKAQNAAGFAGADEDQAGLAVTQARLNEDRAGLATKDAGLGEEEAGIYANQADLNARLASRAPAPGMEKYTDPDTGHSSWMTPSEADQLNYQHSLDLGTSRVTQNYAANQNRQNITDVLEGNGGFAAPKTALDSMPVANLLNMYDNPATYTQQGVGGFASPEKKAAFEKAILSAIARQLKANKNLHMTDAEAESAAAQYVQYELASRKAVGPPGGGGETTTPIP